MKKKLETYSRIENYLRQPIKLMESLGETEDAEMLKVLLKKYEDVVYDHMRKSGIKKLSVSLGRNYQCVYELGETQK